MDVEASLRTNIQKGLEDRILTEGDSLKFLNIGFENDTVEKLAELIPPYPDNIIIPVIEALKLKVKSFAFIGNNEVIHKLLRKKLILDAYQFTNNEDDIQAESKFLHNLNFEYKRLVKYSVPGINLEISEINTFKLEYWKIRSEQDTMRAIYRLSIIGIVDDYVIDYKDRRIFLKFSGKTANGYKNNFEQYLRRYLGKQSTDKWLQQAEKKDTETELRRYVYTLTDFFEQTIAKKRLASAKYMDELCNQFIQNENSVEAEKRFRDNIVHYFTSKYANELIENIHDSAEVEDLQIFNKFLGKIENPPDNEVGLELNNAKHILGACQRFKASSSQSSNVINLLSSFCTLLLESKVSGHLPNFHQSLLVSEQSNICLDAFYILSNEANNDHTSYLYALKYYTTLMQKLIPETYQLCNSIYKIASIFILERKLNNFNKIFLS